MAFLALLFPNKCVYSIETCPGRFENHRRVLARLKLPVRVGMALGSTEAIKRVVAEGVGLAIVSRLSVQAECAAGTLTMDQGAAAARARRQGLCLGAVTIDGDNSTLTINRRKTHGA
jgi:DNA-binding transcriptional LysR family regulator